MSFVSCSFPSVHSQNPFGSSSAWQESASGSVVSSGLFVVETGVVVGSSKHVRSDGVHPQVEPSHLHSVFILKNTFKLASFENT